MTRFFVNPEELNGNEMYLTGVNAAHAKVLRLKPGEKLLISDGQGMDCICEISQCNSDGFVVKVLEQCASTTEPSVRVSIYMAFSKGDKLEHVIQRATELGAYEIVAFPSSRCVSRPDDKSLAKKLERWQKIAVSAAEQSGRGRIPKVSVASSYKEALLQALNADKAILFYENEKAVTLKMALQEAPYSSVSLLSGPEGGLDEQEVNLAKEMGLAVCTLGSRILRCETAPLCALSAVMYDSGEF